MTPEWLFSFASAVVLPGWILLILFPWWRWSARLICPVLIPTLLALLYLFLIVRHFGEAEGGFGSIEAVRSLFENDGALAAGWIHYLAFDLFIGAWEVRDSGSRGIHHLAVVPCLVLTLMLGPVGLLCYLAIRAAWKRSVWIGAERERAAA